MTFDQLDRLAREAGLADNDNRKPLAEDDGWRAPATPSPRGKVIKLPGDGPTIEYRTLANTAWQSSRHYSGQFTAANDNWPLAKVLRRDGFDYFLTLAERYRSVYDRANVPVELIGKDPSDDIYIVQRTALDDSTGHIRTKGTKRTTGTSHPIPEHAAIAFSGKRPKPVAKAWNGDRPLLDRMDAADELAALRSALGVICEPFEAAVVEGDTLEAIGKREGTGQGAGAAGRALVMRGFMAIDQHWQRSRQAA